MSILWQTKRHWGKFSPRYSVSPANHSTNFSIIIIIIIIIIITRGWYNRPVAFVPSGPNWTQPSTIPIELFLLFTITGQESDGELGVSKERRRGKQCQEILLKSNIFLFCST
jgi:hypothetical protein